MTIHGAGLVPAPVVVPARAQVRGRAVDAGRVPGTQDFSVVYSRWMPALTRYCRGILRSDADAEDAAQNAMLKAMDALATGPAPERLPPWLHRIARNEAISLMRRRDGAVALVDDDHPAGPSLEEVASTRRRLAELLQDLQALPARQREALVLREVDGLAHRAIATQLGITEAAAQQAVLDARRSLHSFEAGRALECDSIQSWLSAHEHARLRTRGVRAHLRDCGDCREFSSALGTRPADLAALLPGIGAGGLMARILGLLGGGGGGSAVKAALATGVLATVGAGIVAVPHHAAPRGVDRGRAAEVAPRDAGTRAYVPLPTTTPLTVRPAGAASRSARRIAADGSARSTGGSRPAERPGSTTSPSPASAGAPPAAQSAGTHDAGAADHKPTGHATPASGGSGSGGAATTPAPEPGVPPSVAGAVAPVVEKVTETTAATVEKVTGVVDQVTQEVGVPELQQTIDEVTGTLGGLGGIGGLGG